MGYYEQRPYFEDNDIYPHGSCSVEYGNPSGHTLFASGYGLFIYLDVVYQNPKYGGLAKIGYAIISFIFGFVIAYTRIYLRVHTLN